MPRSRKPKRIVAWAVVWMGVVVFAHHSRKECVNLIRERRANGLMCTEPRPVRLEGVATPRVPK